MTPLPLAPGALSVQAVQRRTMAVLVVSQVIGTIGVGIGPSIGILLAEEATGSEALAGLARTATTLGAALVGVPLGMLAARRGRRVALATGWWAAALGAGLLVIAAQWSSIVPLFAGLLLIGVGSAVSLQARFTATDLAEPRHRARSLALVVWVGTAGAVLGPNLGVPGEAVGPILGLTTFAAAFLIAAVGLAAAGLVVFLLLRPDPLLLLTGGSAARASTPLPWRTRLRQAAAEVATSPSARLAVAAILTAQVVMVAVMTMTPVHIHHNGGTLTLVGITISLHVLGMYALAPVVGVVADRAGPRATIGAGIGVLAVSLGVAIGWSESPAGVIASLILLGVGWSFVNVSGSALFSAVVPAERRAASQGGVDALSNLLGALAAFGSGPLMAATSFSALAGAAVLALVPLTILTALRPRDGSSG